MLGKSWTYFFKKTVPKYQLLYYLILFLIYKINGTEKHVKKYSTHMGRLKFPFNGTAVTGWLVFTRLYINLSLDTFFILVFLPCSINITRPFVLKASSLVNWQNHYHTQERVEQNSCSDLPLRLRAAKRLMNSKHCYLQPLEPQWFF